MVLHTVSVSGNAVTPRVVSRRYPLLQRSFRSRSFSTSIRRTGLRLQYPKPSDCRLPLATTSDICSAIVPPFERLICTARLPLSISVLHMSPLGRDWKSLSWTIEFLHPYLPTVMAHPICEYVQNRMLYLPRRSPSTHLQPSFHRFQ